MAGNGTADELLVAIETRLRAQVEGLNKQNCFICDEPIPPESYFPTGKLACTIALIDGSFNPGHYDGGGANQLTEKCPLAITILSRVDIDQPPRAREALLSSDRGMFRRYKKQVLRAMLVDNIAIASGILVPWQPTNEAGEFIRGAIVPTRCQGPRQLPSGNDPWLGLTIWFDAEFDWDLAD
jgi:hypothetical protein